MGLLSNVLMGSSAGLYPKIANGNGAKRRKSRALKPVRVAKRKRAAKAARLVKGSAAAKAYMAKIRRKRGR